MYLSLTLWVLFILRHPVYVCMPAMLSFCLPREIKSILHTQYIDPTFSQLVPVVEAELLSKY